MTRLSSNEAKFVKAVLKSTPPGLGWVIGVVTDVSPFTVQINGDTVDVVSPPRFSSYTPTLGDTVFIFRTGAGLVVADQIV